MCHKNTLKSKTSRNHDGTNTFFTRDARIAKYLSRRQTKRYGIIVAIKAKESVTCERVISLGQKSPLNFPVDMQYAQLTIEAKMNIDIRNIDDEG